MLYFLHIPKTGGTALSSFLDQYYEEQQILPAKSWNELFQRDLVDKMDYYDFIRGHFGFGLKNNLNNDPEYVTVLRNPVNRTISAFHHIMYDRINNNWVPPDEDLPTELEDMLEHPKGKLLFTNTQTRHIALDLDVTKFDTISQRPFYFAWQDQFVNPEMSDEEMLSKAKENLRTFRFVGQQENMNTLSEKICSKMGWRYKTLEKLNVLPGRPPREQFSEHVIKKIQKMTALDRELYMFSKTL